MMTAFTDGSCNRNYQRENTGGWAYVIVNEHGLVVNENAGKEINTTNNRMEMKAMLECLKKIRLSYANDDVTVFSDSEYVINTLTKNWKKKKNVDLWDQLIPLLSSKIHLKWTKGHSGNTYNEYVDKKASEQTQERKYNIL